MTYQRTGANTGYDVWALPLFGDRMPFPVLATSAPEMGLRFSPDGRYISYRITENNRSDVYVSPFDPNGLPDPTRVVQRWKISVNVGVATAGVRWRADSRELYYIDANGGITAVEVTTTPTFKVGTAKVLFQVPKTFQFAPNSTAGFSDVSADGRTFALMVPQ
jgi:Tol biopolymer transport system component